MKRQLHNFSEDDCRLLVGVSAILIIEIYKRVNAPCRLQVIPAVNDTVDFSFFSFGTLIM